MAELSLEVRNKILAVLHKNEKWIYYENRLKEYKKKNNLDGVKRMQDILHKVEVDAIQNYIDQMVAEQTTVGDIMDAMPEEERQKVMENLHTIVFMCDMIDSCILNVQSTIQKVFPDGEVVFYKNLLPLCEEVKMQIGTVLDTANEKNKELFCKYSDKVQEYMTRQVRYFLRTQEHAKAKVEWNEQHRDKSTRKVRQ